MTKGLSLPEEYINQACDLFRLLSDKTRLSVLLLLSKGEQNVGQLCLQLDLPQPTVSHHLALMRMSGLINKRRQGKQMIYRINFEMLRDMGLKLIEHVSENGKQIKVDQFTFSMV